MMRAIPVKRSSGIVLPHSERLAVSDFNSQKNRVVWVDIPVADLDRAAKFYQAVLNCPIHQEAFGDFKLGVIDHADGNGGCLVVEPDAVAGKSGVLIYLNVNGRIRDAIAKGESHGGKIVQAIHNIGPHGYRAIILDSEGNRVALHSQTDA
jgi:predicted enzyme related to lactoylglutathione lyase